jgi:hypothetical protein
MTVAKHKLSTDDKVEAKRKIIRRSLHEIKAQVEQELRGANLHSSISIVVPTRYSLFTITSSHDAPDEWQRVSAIVREIVAKKLGSEELRSRPLARATATAQITTDELTPD